MSNFFDKRREVLNGTAAGAKAPSHLWERYPTLARLMQGGADAAGQNELPAYSLNLYCEGGELRFCLRARGEDECWFGRRGLADDPLQGIEDALAAGEVDARREKAAFGKAKY